MIGRQTVELLVVGDFCRQTRFDQLSRLIEIAVQQAMHFEGLIAVGQKSQWNFRFAGQVLFAHGQPGIGSAGRKIGITV